MFLSMEFQETEKIFYLNQDNKEWECAFVQEKDQVYK